MARGVGAGVGVKVTFCPAPWEHFCTGRMLPTHQATGSWFDRVLLCLDLQFNGQNDILNVTMPYVMQ